jgi:hypothetical protein
LARRPLGRESSHNSIRALTLDPRFEHDVTTDENGVCVKLSVRFIVRLLWKGTAWPAPDTGIKQRHNIRIFVGQPAEEGWLCRSGGKFSQVLFGAAKKQLAVMLVIDR